MQAERDMLQNKCGPNVHDKTVAGFGDEWTRFDQADLSLQDRQKIFDEYFAIVPPDILNADARVADFGAGSGRWAAVIAPQVRSLICVDASGEALAVAKKNLAHLENCEFHEGAIENSFIQDESLDFAYSLGVLHHIPDTFMAMQSCVKKLKPGAAFLVYLYYRFDNKPIWYSLLWRATEAIRYCVSKLSHRPRYIVSQVIACLIYLPLVTTARLLERLGISVENFPLAYYRSKPFYVMRTDALDRFGTQLEQRFTRYEIEAMMTQCGLERIRFSSSAPYWCALGWKKA